jgi:hypothetical protein
MNPSVGLDCRHPGDRHSSKGAHGHIISMGGVDNQKKLKEVVALYKRNK